MIYEVEVSEQADRDLREIFEYIAFELQSPENAIGQLNRLEEQILSLARYLEVFEAAGYKVKRATAVDQFPNTVHIESMVLLQKDNI